MTTIRNGNVEIATQSFGSPDATPIVLVMGSTASMLWWPDSFCQQLAARGFYVIRYDHRDTGQSTTVPPGEGDYGLMDMRNDLLAVLDGYQLDAAHLVGMSLGGYLTQLAALTAPERVKTITLFAAEPFGWDGPPLPGISDEFLGYFGKMASLDWSDQAAVAEFLIGLNAYNVGTRPYDRDATLARITAELKRTSSIQSSFNHAGVRVDDLPPGLHLSQITQPTLVIHGEADPQLPLPNGKAIAAAIPGAKLLILPGTGHELIPPDYGTMIKAITTHIRAG